MKMKKRISGVTIETEFTTGQIKLIGFNDIYYTIK